MTGATALSRDCGSRTARVRTFITSALLAMLCAAGLLLGVQMLAGHDPLATPRSEQAAAHPFQVGESVDTSFGVIAVEHAQAITGLSETDVKGAHAVPGLVQAGTIEVQVGAVITNLSDSVLAYSPDQFQLLDGAGNVIELTKAPQLPGELQPDAAIDVLLDFVTTTEARPFTVRFIDPDTDEELLIDLGTVGCVVGSGNGLPLESQDGCAVVPTDDHHPPP
jgi:hypothetical protein